MKMTYEVRFYSPQGSVCKDEYDVAEHAIDRWAELVKAGHKSVKLKTKIERS